MPRGRRNPYPEAGWQEEAEKTLKEISSSIMMVVVMMIMLMGS